MPVPTHIRVVVRGKFVGTPEQWSTSFHLSRENGAAPDANYGDIDADGMLAAASTWINTAYFQGSVELGDVRAYVIGTDGKMEGNGPKMAIAAPAAVKGAAAQHKYPPQVSLVVTTVAVNRGPGKFGRMYLPGPAIGLGADGRISAADALTVGDQLATFLKACSDQVDLDLANSSKGLNISEGPAGSATGTSQEIDHLEVGRVLDTLRNRRKSMVEDRSVTGHIDW